MKQNRAINKLAILSLTLLFPFHYLQASSGEDFMKDLNKNASEILASQNGALVELTCKEMNLDSPPAPVGEKLSKSKLKKKIKKLVDKKFSKKLRSKIIFEAMRKHKAYKIGDTITLKVKFGGKYIDHKGELRSKGIDKIVVGDREISKIDLDPDLLDRLSERKSNLKQKEYIKKHYKGPRSKYIKELKQKFKKESEGDSGQYDEYKLLLSKKQSELTSKTKKKIAPTVLESFLESKLAKIDKVPDEKKPNQYCELSDSVEKALRADKDLDADSLLAKSKAWAEITERLSNLSPGTPVTVTKAVEEDTDTDTDKSPANSVEETVVTTKPPQPPPPTSTEYDTTGSLNLNSDSFEGQSIYNNSFSSYSVKRFAKMIDAQRASSQTPEVQKDWRKLYREIKEGNYVLSRKMIVSLNLLDRFDSTSSPYIEQLVFKLNGADLKVPAPGFYDKLSTEKLVNYIDDFLIPGQMVQVEFNFRQTKGKIFSKDNGMAKLMLQDTRAQADGECARALEVLYKKL